MRILWIPHAGWHIPQRAHLFCRALAERHEVHVINWVADFRSLSDYCSKRYFENFSYSRYRDGAITIHRIPRFSPALVSVLRKINSSILSWFVQYIVKQMRIDVVVGTFIVPPPRAPRVIFDMFDDNVAYWKSYGRISKYTKEIAYSEQLYLSHADAVVAVSPSLALLAQERGTSSKVYIIPNGIDLDRFNKANGDHIRQELGVDGPLVGAVGNHDKSVELDKILQAAKSLMSDGITFLIAGRGSAVAAAQEQASKEKITNILWKGYIPAEDAADYISALDVGLCPYKKTPGADASSPMRLLMYSAAGVPAVCTDLVSIRALQLPNVVLVDDHAHALAEGIRSALHLPRQRPSIIEKYDLRKLVKEYENVLQG